MTEQRPAKLYGEDDPQLIRAAKAIAANRNARRVRDGLDDIGVMLEDMEDARVVFAILGMLRC